MYFRRAFLQCYFITTKKFRAHNKQDFEVTFVKGGTGGKNF